MMAKTAYVRPELYSLYKTDALGALKVFLQ